MRLRTILRLIPVTLLVVGAYAAAQDLDDWREGRSSRDATTRAHHAFARYEIARMLHDPAAIEELRPVAPPPGSPIGSHP